MEFFSLTVLLRGRQWPVHVAATPLRGASAPGSDAALHPSLALTRGPFRTPNFSGRLFLASLPDKLLLILKGPPQSHFL